MRTIKFRGFTTNLKHNIWNYGFLVGDCIVEHTLEKSGLTLANKVDIESVGQFTGLCDIEGKEIYEGDIVIKKNDYKEEYVVLFLQGMYVISPYKFRYECNIKEMTSYALNFYILDSDDLYCSKCKNIKVIGNTYENK